MLADCLPVQDGASISAALRAATTPSASAVSADSSDAAAASAGQLRLPGPAIAVEPSAEAVAAVQALFARQPQLVAQAGMQATPGAAPWLRQEACVAPGACVALHAPHVTDTPACAAAMPAKRARLDTGAHDIESGSAAEAALFAPPSSAAGAAAAVPQGAPEATALPSTPQQAVPRRTSAPY